MYVYVCRTLNKIQHIYYMKNIVDFLRILLSYFLKKAFISAKPIILVVLGNTNDVLGEALTYAGVNRRADLA